MIVDKMGNNYRNISNVYIFPVHTDHKEMFIRVIYMYIIETFLIVIITLTVIQNQSWKKKVRKKLDLQ